MCPKWTPFIGGEREEQHGDFKIVSSFGSHDLLWKVKSRHYFLQSCIILQEQLLGPISRHGLSLHVIVTSRMNQAFHNVCFWKQIIRDFLSFFLWGKSVSSHMCLALFELLLTTRSNRAWEFYSLKDQNLHNKKSPTSAFKKHL